MYRHPKAHSISFDYIQDVLRHMLLRKKTLFLFDDLNDDLLLNNSKLSRIIKNNKLSQVIKKPTRITPTSATLLDVVITNKPHIVLSSDVIPHYVAYHDLITITINIRKPKFSTTLTTFWDLRHYDKDTFCWQLLSEVDNLNQILNIDNVNKQVNTLTSVISNCFDFCAPMTTKELRRLPALWITNEIREAMKARNEAQYILKTDRLNTKLQKQYKDLKKTCKNIVS